ncbi:MAG: response regulator [Verrucomicrobiota bacterium]
MKLLIVDDSMIMRRIIERELDPNLFSSIESASNGREALEKFQADPTDFVTMDLTMPEMDGLTCIEQLVRIKPDVNILVVSALGDRSIAVEAVKRGAQGFLLKPFDAESLRTSIQEILEEE